MGNSASKTESIAKRNKINAMGTMCSTLNDDCIEAILRWLPLADLCSLSLTCKRAFQLTSRYFYRQYPDHRMEVTNRLSGPVIKCSENYLKCFSSNIRSIRLTSEYWNLNPVHLFTFLRMHCSEHLRELEFDTINLKCKEIHTYGKQINVQLKNLTTISFVNCTMYDIYHGFLQYCDNLTNLIVNDDESNGKPCYIWLHKTYPHLESFVYYKADSLTNYPLFDDRTMIAFFENNPHIRNVASDYRIVWNISQTNIKLDYLVVRIKHKAFFGAIINELLSICKQKRIQRLQLVFSNISDEYSTKMTDDLIKLGKYVTLELSFAIEEWRVDELQFIIEPLKLEQVPSFKVKSLHLEFCQQFVSDSYFHKLSEMMCDVEEIHLKPWWNEFIVNFRPSIGTFAARFKQLKTLVIHRIDPDIIPHDVVEEMDIWRRKLSGACLLTIYLPSDVIQKINFTIPVGSRVNIKPISTLQRDIFTSDRRII